MALGFETVRSHTPGSVPIVGVWVAGFCLYQRFQFWGQSWVISAEEPVLSFVLVLVSGQ